MFRLRDWTRIGLLAIVIAASTVWVAASVTPAAAVTSGTKSLDPNDPGAGGGGPAAGDPDGPTGDIGPAGGAASWTGGSSISGVYSSSVRSSAVGASQTSAHGSFWAQFRLALHYWLRWGIWR